MQVGLAERAPEYPAGVVLTGREAWSPASVLEVMAFEMSGSHGGVAPKALEAWSPASVLEAVALEMSCLHAGVALRALEA